MAIIDDPTVVAFADQSIRSLGDAVATLYPACKQIEARYFGTVKAALDAGGTTGDDIIGSDTDARGVVDKGNLVSMISLAQAIITTVEGSGNQNLVAKWAVNPRAAL